MDNQNNTRDSDLQKAEQSFCPNCGHPLEQGSQFCTECGKSVDGSQVSSGKGKKSLLDFLPAGLNKKVVGIAAAALVVVLLVIGVVNLLWFFPKDLFLGKVISLVLVILTLADVLVSPYFRYHRYRYSINEECIDIREGYLFVERNIVPIERLHKLQTVKGPLDRFFRVAKVVVTTAGGDVTIRFLEEEKAEAIAESLRNRINQIVKEERNAKEQAADGQA